MATRQPPITLTDVIPCGILIGSGSAGSFPAPSSLPSLLVTSLLFSSISKNELANTCCDKRDVEDGTFVPSVSSTITRPVLVASPYT